MKHRKPRIRAKLNELQVRVCKRANAFGVTHRELAGLFGVSKAAITHAISGRNWKCLIG
jgi:predicted transcriptional regulator